MENQFDKITKFVEALERTSLSDDQQMVLLAGGIYDDTTLHTGNGSCTNNELNCDKMNSTCSNEKCCTGSNAYCTNTFSCESSNADCSNSLDCGGFNGKCTNPESPI